MKSNAASASKNAAYRTVSIQLPQRLYQRVERTARQTGFGIRELIVSTLETGLPPLPNHLPPELAAGLSHRADEPENCRAAGQDTILAITHIFCPQNGAFLRRGATV